MKRILFVCLGNICRSPSAEAVMNALIQDNNLEGEIVCDSAGTIGYHAGAPADSRMKEFAIRRGYDLLSISRQVVPEDFESFDYILGMDDSNIRNLKRMDKDKVYRNKIYKMTDFCRSVKCNEVPDPYYGGPAGFERVLDILEDACVGLLEKVKLDD